MNWNPMMGPLGASASQSPDLGALVKAFAGPQNSLGQSGVTLGNPEAQDQYRQMAEAFVMQQRAAQDQEAANALQNSGWINNSGALGVLDQVFKAYASKKLAKRADEKDIEARERYYKGEAAAEEAKAAREAEKAQAEVARKLEILQRGDPNEILANGIELPKGERGVPMMTDQGLVIVDPYSGGYRAASPEGQQQRGTMQGRNGAFNVSDDLPPEVRQAIIAAEQGNGQVPDDLGVVQRQPQRPLMPYKDPAIAQRQAVADQRADAQLALSERAADRADAAESRAARAAELAAEESRRKLNSRNTALEQWDAAREGLETGLAGSETGPLAGRLPAITSAQQIAEGSVAATAPILKQLFRTAGEGTFTDKDQELLMKMVPTRTDTPEAREAKIANIDRIIRAKLGGAGSAPQADDDRAPTQRIRIKL